MNTITEIKTSPDTSKNGLHSENQTLNPEIQELINFCNSNQKTESQRIMASLLIKAIENKFHTNIEHQHIYLKNDEVPQIQLFNILIEKFPFVKYSQLITNNSIIETIGNSESVSIIDIGIGQGVQMANVIESAKKLSNLKMLQIIGIEPFADALKISEQYITTLQKEVHFKIEFTGINQFIEDTDFTSLNILSDNLIINASLALHHIQSKDKRNDTIAKIKLLNPKAFILIEPNVNHFTSNFSARFYNCYNHYYNIFMVIDRLDIHEKDKQSLKLFFGREINDVIGKEEKDRYEKHELAVDWISRLETYGFTMKPEMLISPVKEDAGVLIHQHNAGYLGFTNEEETVLAVIFAY